jgi:hypothetical protein
VTRSIPFQSTIIFVALTLAGVVMAVVAPTLAPATDHAVLSDVGAALIAGALAFFLVDVTSWKRQHAR